MRLRVFNGHTESCLFLGFEYFDLLTISLKKKKKRKSVYPSEFNSKLLTCVTICRDTTH